MTFVQKSIPARLNRPVTQDDVAREVGVSRALVSLAFRGAPGVSDESRRTILETARRLGYRHNTVAADLAAKTRSTIGLYLLDFRNEVFADVYRGVRDALERLGNRLILAVSDSDEPTDQQAVGSLIEARVGVIIAATLLLSDVEVRAVSQSVPVVSVARKVPGVDSVYADDETGAGAATGYLLDLGHRRIAHITGVEYEGHERRRRTYEATMTDAGLTPQTVVAQGYSQDAAERAARAVLNAADRPTAVFAHNDEMACGVREAAHSLGLRIPEDLSLIGYDNSRVAQLHGIDLTSVDQHARRLGQEAGAAALARMRRPDAPLLDARHKPDLVVRGSTARCATRR
ncbi:LacI family transcriptional regulator [Mycobacterium sp. 852013-50091_SCH5140682]|uniref:LacI family DNA-binding transcriptional regulator n=1 Tax=Mycobacterium sp. 852013-50091_SCH5140682 TaxID=1834109 RepID=UPI0007EABCC8|nr:LacI family DNA-binding transcriptional regulator [Mycobacterium sp. 852013-50091_SCH5140682]OBC04122.1 LacI family transcriptional regulator [Mycobacterium sp. 852013-50091_SCH5140682]